MTKHDVLRNILNSICQEAPAELKIYHPEKNDESGIIKAESKAYIHLFLKAKFGLVDFNDREKYITEGKGDGGLDAYYIDEYNKTIYYIQSKYGATDKNYKEKEIALRDLIKVEVDRIEKGLNHDESGSNYNGKIMGLQNKISKLIKFSEFSKKVIIIANLKNIRERELKKVIGNKYAFEVYNYEMINNEILFPLCSGTYFDPKDITVKIRTEKKESYYLGQHIDSSIGKIRILVIYLPAIEIGRMLDKYRNAILLLNPRNYLGFTDSKNNINKGIRDTLLNNDKDDFSILNNGITILTKKYNHDPATGTQGQGELILYSPQIVNGGQTAYTLCELMKTHEDKIKNREVLTKVIEITTNKKDFTESISDASNKQNEVKEADRRSNHPFQTELQQKLYNDFNYYYERKKGEFNDGIKNKYIKKNQLVKREVLIKTYYAFKGYPAEARGNGYDILYRDKFDNIFNNINDYKKIFYSYVLFGEIKKLVRKYRKLKKQGKQKFGHVMQYGRLALLYVVAKKYYKDYNDLKKLRAKLRISIQIILSKWKKFEMYAKKQAHNENYKVGHTLDFDNYYKGSTLNNDLKKFFK